MPDNKKGTQLLVSPHMLDRARALAIVRQESVAEVWRAALEGGGLDALEDQQSVTLTRLKTALEAMKVNYSEALEIMTKEKYRLADLYNASDWKSPRRRAPWA